MHDVLKRVSLRQREHVTVVIVSLLQLRLLAHISVAGQPDWTLGACPAHRFLEEKCGSAFFLLLD